MGASPLGRVVATPGTLQLLDESGEDPLHYLARHVSGDWGEVDEHDRRENELSLKHDWRILRSYAVGGSFVRIIMEAGPSGYEPDELPDCSTPRCEGSGLEKMWRGCSGADCRAGAVGNEEVRSIIVRSWAYTRPTASGSRSASVRASRIFTSTTTFRKLFALKYTLSCGTLLARTTRGPSDGIITVPNYGPSYTIRRVGN